MGYNKLLKNQSDKLKQEIQFVKQRLNLDFNIPLFCKKEVEARLVGLSLRSPTFNNIMISFIHLETFMANELGSHIGGKMANPLVDYLHSPALLAKSPARSTQQIKQDSLSPQEAQYLLAHAAAQGKGMSPDFLGHYQGSEDSDDVFNYYLNIRDTSNSPAVRSNTKSQVTQQMLQQQAQAAQLQGVKVNYLPSMPDVDLLDSLLNPSASHAQDKANSIHYAGSSLNPPDPHFGELHDIQQADLWAWKNGISVLPAPNNAARTTNNPTAGWLRKDFNAVSSFINQAGGALNILSLMTPETRALVKLGMIANNHQEAILTGAGLLIGAGEIDAGIVGARTAVTAVGKAIRSVGFFSKGGKVTSEAERAANLASKTSDPIIEALKQAIPTPGKTNQLETTLSDGTKVLFRRDIGGHAHEIGDKYPMPVDHYNIEIQVPRVNRLDRFKTVENLHIIVNQDLQPIDIFSNKLGQIYNEPEIYNRPRPQ